MAFLELTEVQGRYGAIQALKGVNLSVEKGQIAAFIGANGAGKSTTLRVISGRMRPSAGDTLFAGQSIAKLKPSDILGQGIVRCPEGRQVFARMSVLDNLKLRVFAHRKQLDWLELIEQILELFPVLGDRRAQLTGTLSGGEQQMLAVGRALMARPRCLLFDEPSLGLAPVVVERIFEVIKQIVSTVVRVLLVEQNANLAYSISDEAYVLEVASITIQGPGKELLVDDRVRSAYVGA
jgi:branched-chain amino acid transport system ATP-binding protein